jgi:2-polyprenyl-3-methyl-5-hydroxy-6-metoxy-1,4-benzoquinol methylase
MALYDAYASLYDRTGQSRFSLRMVLYAFFLWAQHAPYRIQRVLDLACGTGSAAIALARRGYEVTALDLSETMLEKAKDKAARWNAPVTWLQGDLRHFQAGGPFDAVTCFYDALNYMLVPEDLEESFKQVRAHLRHDGLFLFDMITDHAVAQTWGETTDTSFNPDLTRIWKSSYDPVSEIGTLHALFFEREADGRYRRVEEIHRHRGYSAEQVETLLERAGLEVVAAYECLTERDPKPTTYRVAYLARPFHA